MGVYEELKDRGLIAQLTNEEAVRDLLNNKKVKFYIGFDPTADSLHVGHFVQVMVMAHMQKAGHTPIALFGGGTGMIGDPSGKSDMRKMLTKEDIDHNIACFREQMGGLIDFSDGKAIMVNNADLLSDLNYIIFIREIGVHFTISKMLAAECYKQRMERGGLTFFELNYMLMQSYDFYVLNRDYGCRLELGGDDQWSNIIGGVELTRRMAARKAEETGTPVPESTEVYGMTFALLTNSEGKKMGKTESGAVWLDPKKTSPYDFYQYWRNVQDADVIKCLKMLTFMPVSEINELAKLEGSEINKAKSILAYEVTRLIHGKEEADKAKEAAEALFGAGKNADNMPSAELETSSLVNDEISVLDLLVTTKLCPSKSEAKRLVLQGGVSVDDVQVDNIGKTVSKADFEDKGYIIVKKGKKSFLKVTLK